MPSFAANGYLPYEPLVVRQARRGKYMVLEGNRRLAAILSMRDSDDPVERTAYEQKHLSRPPCIVFSGTEREELAYLGLRHLSKTKDWSASAKSAFVERILQSDVSMADAARLTNVSRTALRQMLLVWRLLERAENLGIQLPEFAAQGETAFWHLGDAIRRTNTKRYLKLVENENPLLMPELDENRFVVLIGWIYGNPKTGTVKLSTSIRDIPNIDKCLGHPKSTDALEAGMSIADALQEAVAAGAKVSAYLGRAKAAVQEATGTLSDLDPPAFGEVRDPRGSLQSALNAFDPHSGAYTALNDAARDLTRRCFIHQLIEGTE